MWSRKKLKEKAKKIVKKNYWTILIVCFIIGICTGEYGMSTVSIERNAESADITSDVQQKDEDELKIEIPVDENDPLKHKMAKVIENTINGTANSAIKSQKYAYKIVDGVRLFVQNKKEGAIILFVGGIAAFLFIMFIADPLLVGEKRFFIKIRRKPSTKIGEIVTIFQKDQWLHIAKILLLRNVYTFLWYFTIIGGFVKTYEYSMIPYLLADNPHLSEKEVFRLSKQMMEGNKWNAFVLDLSFMLWYILSVITLGLVGILYVNPYTGVTKTELYVYLKKEAIKKKYEYYEKIVEEKTKKQNSEKVLKKA